MSHNVKQEEDPQPRLITSFDLEPNPFEQSFASTKKENANPRAIGNASATKKSPSVFGSAKPPVIHSPPVLTPGGSRRLPPLLLSPNVLQNASNHAVTIGVQAHTGVTPLLAAAGNVNGTTTPGFFLNLSKTGLTPNESSIRTGLTPSILGNPTSTGLANTSTVNSASVAASASAAASASVGTSTTTGTTVPASATNVTAAPLSAGQFTPGLSSILGLPINGTNTKIGSDVTNGTGTLGTVVEAMPASSSTATTTNTTQRNSPTMALEIPPSKKKNRNSIISPNSTGSDEVAADSSLRHEDFSNKRRKTSSSHSRRPSKVSSPEVVEESKEEQERKRKDFLERNRVAASKFRKRKKEYIKKIETDVQFYEGEYDDLSQCMDILCGTNQTVTPSLVGLLKQALIKQDLNTSLTLCNHIEQALLQTKYVRRNGRNPRREEEEAMKRKSVDEATASASNSDARDSRESTVKKRRRSKNGIDDTSIEASTITGTEANGTGTVSNIPLVINGNTLLSLEDIQAAKKKGESAVTNAIVDNTPVSRHSSLTNLEQQHHQVPALQGYPSTS